MRPGLTHGEALITLATLAVRLDFTGTKAREAARKWVLRHGLPRWFRGRACLVRVSDVDRVLAGEDRREAPCAKG